MRELALLVVPTVVLAASSAAADEPVGAQPKLVTPTAPAAAAPKDDIGYSHLGQIEATLRIGTGLRAITPYSGSVYCGASDTSTATGNAAVCTGRVPFAVDFEGGYGIARTIDLFLELRVGIEADFAAAANLSDGPHPFFLSPGARFYFSETGRTKLFTTAQLVLDVTGYKDTAGASRGSDFGVRNMNGLQIDLDRSYGLYGFIGETLTFTRWLEFELEAGIGVQVRYR